MSLQNFPSFFLDFSEPQMEDEHGHSYEFGRFRLDVPERRLFDSDTQISLTPKAFEVLVLLVQRAGHLVEKEELIGKVWPDSFVEEANVARIVHTLRKKLGDDGNGNRFIETVPTKGYRFVADVKATKEPITDVVIDKQFVDPTPAAPLENAAETPAINEPLRLNNSRRHYLLLGAIVILSVLATGFWVSNGALFPSRWVGIIGHSMNGEAYRHFQEGKLLLEVRTPENYQKALVDFERAIELDPEYTEAYAGKADVKSYQFIGSAENDDIATARAAVKKALELDPNNSYAHTIQCRILGTYDWEFEDAISECQRAVTLGPNDDGAHRELGFALNVVGRLDEALSEMQAAVALSPTSFNKRSLGMLFYMSRRYDEAIGELKQVDDTDPGTTDVPRWLMSCYAMKSDESNAFEQLIKLQQSAHSTDRDTGSIKSAFASGGWLAAVRATMEASSGVVKKRALLTAGLFAQIGEKDKAFDVLNDMRKRRAIMRITVNREPLLDPLRDDTRYSDMLSQMNLR